MSDSAFKDWFEKQFGARVPSLRGGFCSGLGCEALRKTDHELRQDIQRGFHAEKELAARAAWDNLYNGALYAWNVKDESK